MFKPLQQNQTQRPDTYNGIKNNFQYFETESNEAFNQSQ